MPGDLQQVGEDGDVRPVTEGCGRQQPQVRCGREGAGLARGDVQPGLEHDLGVAGGSGSGPARVVIVLVVALLVVAAATLGELR